MPSPWEPPTFGGGARAPNQAASSAVPIIKSSRLQIHQPTDVCAFAPTQPAESLSQVVLDKSVGRMFWRRSWSGCALGPSRCPRGGSSQACNGRCLLRCSGAPEAERGAHHEASPHNRADGERKRALAAHLRATREGGEAGGRRGRGGAGRGRLTQQGGGEPLGRGLRPRRGWWPDRRHATPPRRA